MAKYSAALICGHGISQDGSWDCGCAWGKYTEADLMLPITKSFVKYARKYGIDVYSDADKDNNKNMIATIAEANKRKVDVYISVHCDYSLAPSGTYPYYCEGSAKGHKLADTLNKEVMKEMGIGTRGVHASSDLGEVTQTNMVACIFEVGGIKADINILKNKPEAYGKALAHGLCNYFGIKWTEDTAETTTSNNTTHKVPFKIVPKTDLKIRKEASLDSAVVDAKAKKGSTYTIVEVSSGGTRGKLKNGKGWVTITDKYVDFK